MIESITPIEASECKKTLTHSNSHLAKGEVALVGAGPGDPELLTLKALRFIRQADIIIYDRLVSKEILEYAPGHAEKYYVGKKLDYHSVPQDKINQLLVQYAKQGKRVVRLKGGDPFIFGRGGEEIESLIQEQIPWHVIPGITAASGCTSYAGIPLTHRDYAHCCTFITGHLQKNELSLPWAQLATSEQTLVFYMGLKAASIISTKLQEHGMSATTPAALIERGTTNQQRVGFSTLHRLAETAEVQNFESPTLIVIGDVVKLANSNADAMSNIFPDLAHNAR